MPGPCGVGSAHPARSMRARPRQGRRPGDATASVPPVCAREHRVAATGGDQTGRLRRTHPSDEPRFLCDRPHGGSSHSLMPVSIAARPAPGATGPGFVATGRARPAYLAMLPPKQRILDAHAWSAGGWLLLALLRTSLRVVAIPRPLPAAAAVLGQVCWRRCPGCSLRRPSSGWRRASPGPGASAPHHRRSPGPVAGMSLLDAAWGWLVLPLAGYPMTLPPGVFYLVRLDQVLFLYLGLTGVGVALRHRRRSEEARMRGATLEAQLLHARLHVLALQLHPHFLFNTLNTISELVHRNASAAQAMLADLADLLHRSLDAGAIQEVTLRDELELLEPYARIQRTRFSGSLDIRTEIDPEAMGARVPRLLLQPLVENAIRHGTARRTGPGRIAVRGRGSGGRWCWKWRTTAPDSPLRPLARDSAWATRGRDSVNCMAARRVNSSDDTWGPTRGHRVGEVDASLAPWLEAPSRSPDLDSVRGAGNRDDDRRVPLHPPDDSPPWSRSPGWLLAVVGAQEDFLAGLAARHPQSFTSVLGAAARGKPHCGSRFPLRRCGLPARLAAPQCAGRG